MDTNAIAAISRVRIQTVAGGLVAPVARVFMGLFNDMLVSSVETYGPPQKELENEASLLYR